MIPAGKKRKRGCSHPYLAGNFAPVRTIYPQTPCSISGDIPDELAGGQYVRNGGNPITNEDLGRDYHWFDGDGMLAGVSFQRPAELDSPLQANFVNQFILTDLYLSASSSKTRSSIVPSISTLVSPASGLLCIVLSVLRTLLLVLLSHLPGSRQTIKRISVANTGLFYHDGRALATCESGPPMRVQLPGLETVGWYNGHEAEGERDVRGTQSGFGGDGLIGWMKEWTTGHPKVDPNTGELVLYHCTFMAPYVHYSVIPPTAMREKSQVSTRKIMNVAVPGVSGAKMMHDFGVSSTRTIIMDLPLSLDPLNIAKGRPVVSYYPTSPARFGIFARHDLSTIRWFETPACCIFHTANTWDEKNNEGSVVAVNLLACRLTSPALIFAAGNVPVPRAQPRIEQTRKGMPPFFRRYDNDDPYIDNEDGCDKEVDVPTSAQDAFEHASALEESALDSKQTLLEMSIEAEEEQCRLYYYRFSLASGSSNVISHQFALSAIPFEFPTVHPALEMSAARYVFGCSSSTTSFNMALGRAVKIDTIVKIDALSLITTGGEGVLPCHNCVDARSIHQVLEDNKANRPGHIYCYKMPQGWYAQEARFVPRQNAQTEDDGFLLFYAFDESQLDEDGNCSASAVSELWILDARTMYEVVCRVRLPQRVPYGFHGQFFTEKQIKLQAEVGTLRKKPEEGAHVLGRINDTLVCLLR